MENRRILFVGGGSGGHISPLLAVMEAVQKNPQAKNLLCTYVGLAEDLESPLIKNSALTFECQSIHAGKLNRFFTWRHLGQLLNFLRGLREAEQLVKRLKPAAVFAKGGFVGVPVVLAAARRGIPVYCHETDVIPGLANRIVARSAQTIFTAFPAQEYHQLPGEKLRAVGQPVREEFYNKSVARPQEVEGKKLSADLPILTVIGGSQGAHQINSLIQKSWPVLLEKMSLVHLCGRMDLEWLEQEATKLPAQLRERLILIPFLSEGLAAIFRASSLVISRAGGTIAELAATGSASILLPLSTAAQNHQWANARILEKAGAAVVLDEEIVTAEELTKTILELIDTSDQRKALSRAIQAFAHPEAAQKMAEVLLQQIGKD